MTTLSLEGERVVLAQDTRVLRYTHLYTPPQDGSIAIEPLSGATNCFNLSDLGLITLLPRETVEAWARITMIVSGR
jgi:galactose mutarotase-like enzyme